MSEARLQRTRDSYDDGFVVIVEELKLAAQALFTAAHVIKESGASPVKASRAYEAARRASEAHRTLTGAGQDA